ncbi:MAG TPA: RNA polymerase sigma factor SigZ [Eudoraea sp.]|nr:RNA polymerase sigma factor SigZ [Eudoraea sp.]
MNYTVQNIWNEFNHELKGFIFGKVGDESIADDILQDVFIKIMDNMDKVARAKSIQNYLYGIARNTTMDHFRKADKKKALEKDYAPLTDEETQSLNATIADRCIKPFINQIPEKYRHALLKTEFEQISQKDLARELNISYSAAKSRVQRGRLKLKELILGCCNLQKDKYGNLLSARMKNCSCS